MVLQSFFFETTSTLLKVIRDYFCITKIYLGVNNVVTFGEWKTLISEQILIMLTPKDMERQQM